MYIKEYENVEIVLNNKSQCVRWGKDFGFIPEINKKYLIHWSKLKTKKDYRIKFIKVKCDDCGGLFDWEERTQKAINIVEKNFFNY
jgi:hypothetical protein